MDTSAIKTSSYEHLNSLRYCGADLLCLNLKNYDEDLTKWFYEFNHSKDPNKILISEYKLIALLLGCDMKPSDIISFIKVRSELNNTSLPVDPATILEQCIIAIYNSCNLEQQTTVQEEENAPIVSEPVAANMSINGKESISDILNLFTRRQQQTIIPQQIQQPTIQQQQNDINNVLNYIKKYVDISSETGTILSYDLKLLYNLIESEQFKNALKIRGIELSESNKMIQITEQLPTPYKAKYKIQAPAKEYYVYVSSVVYTDIYGIMQNQFDIIG